MCEPDHEVGGEAALFLCVCSSRLSLVVRGVIASRCWSERIQWFREASCCLFLGNSLMVWGGIESSALFFFQGLRERIKLLDPSISPRPDAVLASSDPRVCTGRIKEKSERACDQEEVEVQRLF